MSYSFEIMDVILGSDIPSTIFFLIDFGLGLIFFFSYFVTENLELEEYSKRHLGNKVISVCLLVGRC